ncbi:hypothetical protein GGS20DRAFT_248978 [Poronia punctata]|nr:hypothetical protein GGS20DRAFT_248978 [Poronia punctata]
MFRTTGDLIPNVIRRRSNRPRPYATVVGVNGVVGVVSFADLENWSNRAARFLDTVPDDKVLYMGANDVRYVVWIIAAMKTGKCVLFPSLANQVAANQRFFETVGSKTLVYAPEIRKLLTPLLDATRGAVEHVESQTYEELTSRDVSEIYPFERTFDEIKDVKFLGLHTSGTSGHPKPIFWTPLAVSSLASFRDPSIYDANGNNTNLFEQLLEGNDVLVPFPLSHFGGIGNVMAAMYSDTTLVLPAPGTQLTPENYSLLLQIGKCTATAAPPSLLEAMLSYPPGMDVLASLKRIAYTGGPMNPSRGKALAERLPHLYTVLASTEGGVSRLVSTGDSSRWNSFKFFDVGQRMEEVAPGIYELVYPRSEAVDRIYAFFHTHPHLELEYRTSDLFSPEGNDGWWVYRGRADNWIAMSNGLKMDPTGIENEIASHPDVKGVLVAGSHRFRLCLLVELAKPQGIDHGEALEKLWPTLEAANMKVPKFGRIPKELVIFASPNKPFLRAGKGTIQRRLTIQAYGKEIDELYANVEEGLLVRGLSLPSSMDPDGLIPFLETLFSETLLEDDIPDHRISADDDLLALGLDSFSAFVLLARLKAVLRKTGVEEQNIQKVDHKLLYSATTVRQLAEILSRLNSASAESLEEELGHDLDDTMSQLLDKYSAEVKQLTSGLKKTQARSGAAKEQVVVLTGSTGSLGSYILASLLSRSSVKKIICLNRSSSSLSAQESSFKQRGLPALTPNDKTRISFIQVDPTASRLGLSVADYEYISREATHIIHNAYPVNFLLSLSAFAPQFKYLLNIMRLALHGQGPEILFVSSITAATAEDASVVEESVLHQEKGLLKQGYARSKYLCERLLAQYASDSGNQAAVLRVGQVCGPVSGTTGIRFWNAAEWLPSLVISSKFIGAVPDSLGGEVDWVPVDKLGDIVSELIASAEVQGFRVFNIVHPSATTWDSLLPSVMEGSQTGAKGDKNIEVVSPSEWIDRLEKSERGSHVIHINPAVKLLDFYRQTILARAATRSTEVRVKNLIRSSKTARGLEPIGEADLARWMKGWGI